MRARWLAAALALAATPATACSNTRVDPEGDREARAAMLFTVASQFREPSASLGVLEFEPVTFADACLEIRRLGPCAREPTAGYRLRLTRRGEAYEYRAPAASPADVALASAPDPRIGSPGLAWRWETAPGGCQTLLVSIDARAAVGWCDGPILGMPWMEGGFSAAEWSYLHARFQSFQRDSAQHALAFAGTGGDIATPAWQRAIDSWASLRWSELRAGRSGAAHGRALAYRRPVRARAGYCDVLEVTEYGVAWLGRSMCEGGGGEPGKAVWLSDELWERMDEWLRGWSPYTDETAGIYFFGTGPHAPDAAEARELARWMDRAMAHVASTPREAWPGP
jgi:hypothetical protein